MQKVDALVRPLLTWFAKNARNLPWRRTTDPYAIWVSEIMLQQTQVKTVIPYWEHWMECLPTIEALAGAKLEQVLKLWEGLGYYTRARNLHRAAQLIVQEHRGVFPRHFDGVLALPGIGRYTAGAICSIAFNQPTPVLDGNVTRVLARLFAIGADPREPRANQQLWRLAEGLVQSAAVRSSPGSGDCSHLNQALMELGATVCTPRAPICQRCPMQRFCAARNQNRVPDFPNLRGRARGTLRSFLAFVLCSRGRFLVRQRPAGVVNAHLWEFPNIEVTSKSPDLHKTARACLGVEPDRLEPLATIKHSITRYRITMNVFTATTINNVRPNGGVWRTRRELEALTFPSAHRKIVDTLKAPGR